MKDNKNLLKLAFLMQRRSLKCQLCQIIDYLSHTMLRPMTANRVSPKDFELYIYI